MKKSGSTNNSGQSSSKFATLASKVLQDLNSSKVSKTLAASALSQAQSKRVSVSCQSCLSGLTYVLVCKSILMHVQYNK
jgi:hypothetical protein